MNRVHSPRLTLLGRTLLFLAAFGISLLLQMAIERYHTEYVIEPLERRTENIQTISLFLNAVEKCMNTLDDYRWDYGNAQALTGEIEAYLREASLQGGRIQSDIREVSEAYYLLVSAARTTHDSLTVRLREIERLLNANLSADAARLYYSQAAPCGAYLLQYTRELLERAILDNQENYTTLNTLSARLKQLQTAALLFSVFLAALMTVSLISLLRSIVQMSRSSRQISEGQLDIPDVMEGSDEIGQMAKAFNEMKRSMRQRVELLNKNNAMERELHAKETEALELQNLIEQEQLQRLRSQINPHFLFNTMNVIMYTAKQENAKQTRALLDSLTRTFRYALGSNDSQVPLSAEIRLVNSFYSLYRARFGDQVALQWHFPPELELTEAMVPSFMIQPLVENAFNHGVTAKEGGGRVDIGMEARGDVLVVRVSDDGAGMSAETLAGLREQLKKPPKTGDHIGLYNVAARLRLLGECYDLTIRSEEGRGTEVTIRMPLVMVREGGETE